MRRFGYKIRGSGGSYTVLGIHAKGGQGHILRARHETGREVAIKVPIPDSPFHDELCQKLTREGRLLEQLRMGQIPGVLKHIEHGVCDRTPFLACEFIDGETLEERLRQPKPIPLATALKWFCHLSQTMAGVHRRGIVHADLNPRNIMVRDNATIVLDFGIAREVHETPILASGSIGYIAPEILLTMGAHHAEGVMSSGPAQDVYALGAILYELVTGRAPFQTSEDTINIWFALAYQHISQAPPTIRNPDIGEQLLDSLNTLIQGMLTKQPEQRLPLDEAHAQGREILHQLERRNSFATPPLWFLPRQNQLE